MRINVVTPADLQRPPHRILSPSIFLSRTHTHNNRHRSHLGIVRTPGKYEAPDADAILDGSAPAHPATEEQLSPLSDEAGGASNGMEIANLRQYQQAMLEEQGEEEAATSIRLHAHEDQDVDGDGAEAYSEDESETESETESEEDEELRALKEKQREQRNSAEVLALRTAASSSEVVEDSESEQTESE